MSKHFDGWGRPILGYLEMLKYYRADPGSLRIIRSLPSSRYVVVPTVYIVVRKFLPENIEVRTSWPGNNKSVLKNIDQHALLALRALYRSPEASWRHITSDAEVTFIRRGKVFPCVWSNINPFR